MDKIKDILNNEKLTAEQKEEAISELQEKKIKDRVDREIEKNKKELEKKDLTTKEIQDRLLQIEKKYEDVRNARVKDKFKDKHEKASEYLNKGLSEEEVMKLLDIKHEQTSIKNPDRAPGVEQSTTLTKEEKAKQDFEKLEKEYAAKNPYYKI